jgi:TBC1 domain family member 6
LIIIDSWRKVEQVKNICQVSCGGAHVVALKDDGSVVCWGLNHKGQVGEFNVHDAIVREPQLFRESPDVLERGAVAVAAGSDFSACILAPTGGTVGTPNSVARSDTSVGSGSGSSQSRGPSLSRKGSTTGKLAHHFQIPVGTLVQWGNLRERIISDYPLDGEEYGGGADDQSCQLPGMEGAHSTGPGDGGDAGEWTHNPFQNRYAPVSFQLQERITVMACGDSHTLCVDQQGGMWAFGRGHAGQLGNGLKEDSAIPVACKLPRKCRALQVSCGYNHSAMIDYDGSLYTWGCGTSGQLGLGTSTKEAVIPRMNETIRDRGRCSSVQCNHAFTACLMANGEVYTWGSGEFGRLGHGDLSSSFTPKMVSSLQGKNIRLLVVGSGHVLALGEVLRDAEGKVLGDSRIDDYGFALQREYWSAYDVWHSVQHSELSGKRKKWERLLASVNGNGVALKKSSDAKKLARKGIPPESRRAVWKMLLDVDVNMKAQPHRYQELLSASESKFDPGVLTQIGKDLERTFPNNDRIHSPEGLEKLRRVLSCFSLHYPKVGYCQSMNFITALLLLHFEEEEAFWALHHIIVEIVPGYYEHTMTALRADQSVIEHLMRTIIPNLSNYFEELGVAPYMYITAWFLPLFAERFPAETTLRIWDCLFMEGWKVLFRVALAILQMYQTDLMDLDDLAEVSLYLKDVTKGLFDANELMKIAMKGLFKHRKELNALRNQHLEQLSMDTYVIGPPGRRRTTTSRQFFSDDPDKPNPRGNYRGSQSLSELRSVHRDIEEADERASLKSSFASGEQSLHFGEKSYDPSQVVRLQALARGWLVRQCGFRRLYEFLELDEPDVMGDSSISGPWSNGMDQSMDTGDMTHDITEISTIDSPAQLTEGSSVGSYPTGGDVEL